MSRRNSKHPKVLCTTCGKQVRKIGKHYNQKHRNQPAELVKQAAVDVAVYAAVASGEIQLPVMRKHPSIGESPNETLPTEG